MLPSLLGGNALSNLDISQTFHFKESLVSILKMKLHRVSVLKSSKGWCLIIRGDTYMMSALRGGRG